VLSRETLLTIISAIRTALPGIRPDEVAKDLVLVEDKWRLFVVPQLDLDGIRPGPFVNSGLICQKDVHIAEWKSGV
jgi:hypothetical protein